MLVKIDLTRCPENILLFQGILDRRYMLTAAPVSENQDLLAPLHQRYREGETPLAYLHHLAEIAGALDDSLVIAGADAMFRTYAIQRKELGPKIGRHVPVAARRSWLAICDIIDRAQDGRGFYDTASGVRQALKTILQEIARISEAPEGAAGGPSRPLESSDADTAARLALAADPFHSVPSSRAASLGSSAAGDLQAGVDGTDHMVERMLERATVA
jgi:hypothetical protein